MGIQARPAADAEAAGTAAGHGAAVGGVVVDVVQVGSVPNRRLAAVPVPPAEPELLRELLRFRSHQTTATIATMTTSQMIQSIAEPFCP